VARIPIVSNAVDYLLPRIFSNLYATIKASNSGAADRIMSAIGHREAVRYANLSKYTDQAGVFGTSSWVYIAVDIKATAASLVNLNVLRREGAKKIAVDNHPLELLFQTPNTFQTQLELIYNTVAYLELTGNAYWFLNGAPAGAPAEIIPMRPDRVRIVPGYSTDRMINGYIYDLDGVQIPLAPEEVLHFKLFNPRDDYYGMSRLESAALAIQTDIKQQEYNRNFFGKNKGIPAGVVNVENMIPDVVYEQLKRDWENSYGGTERKTAFLRGGTVKWQDVGISQTDMDFLAGRQFNKEEILQIYRIPPGLIDKNTTEANALAAFELFTTNTIWPSMMYMAQKIQATILPYYGDNLVLEPDDIRRKDGAAERAEIQAASSFLTINEVREDYYNKPPRSDGDLYAAGAGSAAATGQAVSFDKAPKNVKPETPDTQTNQEDNTEESGNETEPTKTDSASADFLDSALYENLDQLLASSPSLRAELRQFKSYVSKGRKADKFKFNHIPSALTHELHALASVGLLDLYSHTGQAYKSAQITSAAGRVSVSGVIDPDAKEKAASAKKLQQETYDYFTSLQNQILSIFRSVYRASKDDPTDKEKEGRLLNEPVESYDKFWVIADHNWWAKQIEDLRKIVEPVVGDMVDHGADSTYYNIRITTGLRIDPTVFHVDAAKYAALFTDKVLQGLNSTTQDGVGAILASGIRQGATMPEIVQALKDSRLFSPDRAAMIAETETTRAFAAGNYIAAKRIAETAKVNVAFNASDVNDLLPRSP
jgi:HK97 family phage portal protein